MLLALLLISCVAFANGANDLSRATATLIGGRVTLYRKAVYWTVSWTLAGSLLSGLLARGVAMRFAHAIQSSGLETPAPVLSAALAAFICIAIATRRGLPISTTHALLGGIVGVVWLRGGLQPGNNLHLLRGFVLPLITSPILAILLVLLLRVPIRRLWMDSLPSLNRTHWVSSGLVALCRGINDSAKIWALAIPLAATSGFGEVTTSRLALFTVTTVMALGGLFGGRRVTETVAHRITKMDLHESLAANLSTSLILIAASLLSFPVASSHVLGGAVFGTGIAKNRALRRGLAAQMAIAWTITLPAAALLAAFCEFVFSIHLGWILLVVTVLTTYVAFLKAAPPAVHPHVGQRLFIFVCSGNTSRSPMAMWICRAEFARRLGIPVSSLGQKGIRIVSAGLDHRVGQPMTVEAEAALIARGISPEPHQSSNLTVEMALEAEAIYCMTTEQRDAVAHRFPFAASKTLRLDRQLDLPNPAGKDQAVYERVASLIHAAVTKQFAATIFA
jgi:inorganic phosphate transporter, PiT family